ncbi:Hypothetical protein A7982_05619 [Minicystis rosea]|nr:Hypothetical protein A7982_05619 [Minicystis rosea]
MFQNDLAAGELGLRWSLPDTFEVTKVEGRRLLARDSEREVLWLVRILPWSFDLRPAFDDVLRADVEADARRIFEVAFKPMEWPTGSGTQLAPRTSDLRWSPIVELARERIGDAPALRVIHRLTYQPSNEVVSGTLLVPLADGFAEIVAMGRAAMTGFRESTLMLQRPGELPPKGDFPRQAEYDDPAHDVLFPMHPLSQVRAALRWLLADAGLAVTKPPIDPPEGEHLIEAAGCAVVLPPRYRFVPPEVMRMSPTLASFLRVGLIDASMRLLDVWRLEKRVEAKDRALALKRLARETVEGWEREGAADIQQTQEVVPSDGPQVTLRTVVRYRVGKEEKVTVMRWRAEADGVVFRVAVGAPPHVPEQELHEQADAVMASLRRLDERPGAGGESKKPWWKVW